jgi:hypothetical protein
MDLKKTKLMAALGVMFAATLFTGSFAQAGGTAPGEGYYAGLFMGHGTGVVQADVNVLNAGNNTTANFETDRGGLGLSGIQGGAWLGWGMKTADDLYFGFEISGAGSDEKIELKSSIDIIDNNNNSPITSATASRNWVAGGAVRVGYYVNSETLVALSGGVAVSQFGVDIGSDSENYYAGGPQVGASITTTLSKLDPNLSLRMEFVYTDYLTADINGIDGNVTNGVGNAGHNNDSTLTGHDSAGRIGVTYRF